MKRLIRDTAAMLLAIVVCSFAAFANAPANDNFANAIEIGTVVNLSAHFTATNVEATKEANEPLHADNQGGSSIWYKWTATSARPMQITLARSNFDTVLAVYKGTSLSTLTYVIANDNIGFTNNRSKVNFTPQPGVTYYIAVDGHKFSLPAATGTVMFDMSPQITRTASDYDRDGITDIAVFRPSDGNWYIYGSSDQAVTIAHWGMQGDIPVVGVSRPGGMTSTDYAVFRPSNGVWYRYWTFATGNLMDFYNWGQNGDIPLTGNFVGFGDTDLVVFRPSTGAWYAQSIGSDGRPTMATQFGSPGDIPVPADFDADHMTDMAVFRPEDGNWYINSSLHGTQVIHWGMTGDVPVPGDYDSDGIADLAVYRPSEGNWYVRKSFDGSFAIVRWGLSGDKPALGDFDGDGRFDFALFRPSNGTWYIRSNGGGTQKIFKWGLNGDIPVTSNIRG